MYLLSTSIFFSAMFLSDGTVISISLQVEFTKSLTTMSEMFCHYRLACLYSSVTIDWHVSRDCDVGAFIVHLRLWLMLVPFVCNLCIMIFTDAPMEICCGLIVPGDVLCLS